MPKESGNWRGKIGRLDEKEMAEFLSTGTWLAKLGCIRPDGSPAVIPLLYDWDGKDFYLVVRAHAEWVQYLEREPRVALCIDEQGGTIRKVLVDGRAEIVEGPNVGGRWVEVAERMCLRYFGPTHGPDYLKSTLDRPRYLIKVVPDKITTWQGVAWHRRYLRPIA